MIIVRRMDAPQTLDGASVVRSTVLGGLPSRARHVVDGVQIESIFALAMARYPEDSGLYLFYCDAEWRVMTDTFHDNVASAAAQAEYEFGPLTWTDASG
jgi:hypothetical protein